MSAQLSNFLPGKRLGAFAHLVVLCLAVAGVAHAQTWNVDADGFWTTNAFWTPQNDPDATDAVATFGSIITANRTITVNKNITLGTLNINDNNNYTLAGGFQLRMNVLLGSAAINIQNSGSPAISAPIRLSDNLLITHTGTGLFTISGVISQSAAGKSLTHSGTGTTRLSGANTYTGTTTVSGGILDVRNNSALGTTAAGTVVSSGASLALGGGVTITNESLQIAGGGAGGAGALNNANASNTFSGNITLSANAEIENSVAGTTLTIGNTAFTNWINTTAAGYTVTFDGPGDIFLNSGITGTGTLTTVGPGNVVKNGTGTLTFYADENWYSGSTTVNDGNLVLDTLSGLNGAIKGAVVNVGDGTGSAGSAILRNGALVSPAATEMIGDAATLFLQSDGLYNLNAQTETIGALDFTGGEVRTGAGGSLRIAAASPAASITSQASSTPALIDATGGSFHLNGSRAFAVADGAAATDLEVRGNITDGTAASGITKAGAGTLALTGANTYTGTTTISAGTLEARNNTALGTTSAGTTVASGATLALSNNISVGDTLNIAGTGVGAGGAIRNLSGSNTLTGLVTLAAASRVNSDAGTLTLDVAAGDAVTGAFAITVGGAGNVTIADRVNTGAGLTKDGAGTLTLSGTGNVLGAVTVSGGQLALMGSTTGGSIAINAGGTLSGTGTSGGLTTISGQHMPGTAAAPVGTQTFSAGLAYDAGSTLSWDLAANSVTGPGTNFDQALVTGGNLTITAGSNLNLVFNGAGSSVLWSNTFWDTDRSWTFIQNSGAGTTTGLFTSLTPSPDSGGFSLATLHPTASFAVAQVGNNVVLNYAAIPEPSTVALLLGASVIALRRRRR